MKPSSSSTQPIPCQQQPPQQRPNVPSPAYETTEDADAAVNGNVDVNVDFDVASTLYNNNLTRAKFLKDLFYSLWASKALLFCINTDQSLEKSFSFNSLKFRKKLSCDL